MAKQHGKATIKINGEAYKSRNGATLDPGGVTRTPDQDYPGDYTESSRPAQIDCTFAFTSDVSPIDINAIVEATVVFESDNGKSFVIAKASSDGNSSIGSDGINATFFGKPAEEMS